MDFVHYSGSWSRSSITISIFLHQWVSTTTGLTVRALDSDKRLDDDDVNGRVCRPIILQTLDLIVHSL